jgi:glyoxalase/bleomycin resistance protein/dioxygenase superfamily protein
MTGAAAARFGPVMQLGFVVPDLERAARHWAGLGIGPFFLLEHIRFAECSYRDTPVSFDMSAALAQWGPVQVELIEQHDFVATVYTDFAGARSGGLHHVGVLTDSIAAQLEALAANGISAIQSGSAANGIRFAYLDSDSLPGSHPGAMIELIQRCPAIDDFFGRVREAALDWDGTEPLRTVRAL